MTWEHLWVVFKADPLIWLLFFQGLLAILAIIRSKKSNWFLGLLIFTATATAAVWMLRKASEQQDSSLAYAGAGWLVLSLFWLVITIKLFRKTHPKKSVIKK